MLDAIIVSTATVNIFHLLPVFYAHLCKEAPRVATRLAADWSDTFPADFLGLNLHGVKALIEDHKLDIEDVDYFFHEVLWEAMEDVAPNGMYFGAHEGDGAAFGYWPIPEDYVPDHSASWIAEMDVPFDIDDYTMGM